MRQAVSSAPRRAITSVDLGDLRERVAELSAASGVGPSTWLRDLVRRELAGCTSRSDEPAPADTPTHEMQSAVYRAWLDANLTAKLDRVTQQGGFRSRAAALRALLDGIEMSASAGASTGEAIRALGSSNHHLVAIGRNINQIAKALHAAPGKTRSAERIALDEAVIAIHKHLELAAVLVGQLRPMLKSERAKP